MRLRWKISTSMWGLAFAAIAASALTAALTARSYAQQPPPAGDAMTVSFGLSSGDAPGVTPEQGANQDVTEVAKKLENPIGDLISVPFENYTTPNVGPSKGTQNVLNLEPVVPSM